MSRVKGKESIGKQFQEVITTLGLKEHREEISQKVIRAVGINVGPAVYKLFVVIY